jgi:hypothetical protein
MSHSYCVHGIDVENHHCLKCPPSPLDRLLDLLADHLATLESAGLGGAAHVDFQDVTRAAADNFEQLRDAYAAIERPKHGAPLGGYAEIVGAISPAAPEQPLVSRWRCPCCKSRNVQVSLPTWYRESMTHDLQFVDTDAEADIAWWYCDDCGETDSGIPDDMTEFAEETRTEEVSPRLRPIGFCPECLMAGGAHKLRCSKAETAPDYNWPPYHLSKIVPDCVCQGCAKLAANRRAGIES